jgi:ParB family transcriptional regulator, chromosome partitioning protein
MTARRSGLGRGLGALIPDAGAPAEAAVHEVDVDLIISNPQQPRSVFEPEALAELAQSIREHGVIQPLIVSRREGDSAGIYQLIAGERRLLAARQAGLKFVPVVVKEASPQALLELALVENLQREDLGPLEEAAAFRRLAEDFGLTQDAIAARVSRSRSAVTNTLRLLTLPPEIQASLARGEITAGHGRAILGLEDPADQLRLWQRIVEGALTVRDAEGLARKAAPRLKKAPSSRRRSPDLAAIEERLRAGLGTRVEISRSARGGRVTIHFFSDEELETIIERLAGS